MKKIGKILRTLWITFGILFLLWMANSFRAHGVDDSILISDSRITVAETDRFLAFRPNLDPQPIGLIFLPGGMVQPEAYAPMARTVAEQGYSVFIIKLPWGSAPLKSQEAEVTDQLLTLIQTQTDIQAWAVGGHSRGAAIASRFALVHAKSFDSLILIGTSHPKEIAFDLSQATLPVTKIYASEDGLASQNEVETNALYLPADTTWVLIAGGNHSQFAYAGQFLGDGIATISRTEQQALTMEAILNVLSQLQATLK